MEDPYFWCESTKFSRADRNNQFFSIFMESIIWSINSASKILNLNLILMLLNLFCCKILCKKVVILSSIYFFDCLHPGWCCSYIVLNLLTIWASLFFKNVLLLKNMSSFLKTRQKIHSLFGVFREFQFKLLKNWKTYSVQAYSIQPKFKVFKKEV